MNLGLKPADHLTQVAREVGLEHGRAGAHKEVFGILRRLPIGRATRAVLHIGDAVRRERVRTRIGRDDAAVMRSHLQPFEKRRHRIRIVARTREHAEARAIRLMLGRTREPQLIVDGEGL